MHHWRLGRSAGSIHRVVSERKRREAAYKDSVAAVSTYIQDEDADLYNLLDNAVTSDALGAAYRLTYLAARSVEELAGAAGEAPVEVLNRLIQETHR